MSSSLKEQDILVVLSGGQDSTTCLFWAIKNFRNVKAIGFNYGQRHELELQCARKICEENNVSYEVLDMGLLNQLTTNSLTRKDIEVQAAKEGESTPNSLVEGRNMIFLTFAAVYAKTHNIKHIVTGVSQSDFSGYPDCRDTFIKSLNVTLNLSMDYEYVIHTPLMWLDKCDTWKLSDDLGVLDTIKDRTLTCYNGIIGAGCGICPSCLLRARGLEEFYKKYR
ncbi:7-cyano-7-deazaguanine synthase QueC [Clostridium cellulovorans]|uniref:7-cyano-7-deazaguanine synthase n=1 Tax=Clostridium cellulovorans (strain ATCC 35296 / DSM 3052 / OCM 3 / 743B) TaxID=573061 RepID=D9SUQ8_CLOC7|nr:7-cyano-7-deazaguanine synthase QueC [Clostridium cellulovorans]ADL50963.1 exsB protein [Clostridium cellulovorans 743B]